MEDLQEYVEILKAELEASKKREKARKVSCSAIDLYLRPQGKAAISLSLESSGNRKSAGVRSH